jgi:hypothetical protein
VPVLPSTRTYASCFVFYSQLLLESILSSLDSSFPYGSSSGTSTSSSGSSSTVNPSSRVVVSSGVGIPASEMISSVLQSPVSEFTLNSHSGRGCDRANRLGSIESVG